MLEVARADILTVCVAFGACHLLERQGSAQLTGIGDASHIRILNSER